MSHIDNKMTKLNRYQDCNGHRVKCGEQKKTKCQMADAIHRSIHRYKYRYIAFRFIILLGINLISFPFDLKSGHGIFITEIVRAKGNFFGISAGEE